MSFNFIGTNPLPQGTINKGLQFHIGSIILCNSYSKSSNKLTLSKLSNIFVKLNAKYLVIIEWKVSITDKKYLISACKVAFVGSHSALCYYHAINICEGTQESCISMVGMGFHD